MIKFVLILAITVAICQYCSNAEKVENNIEGISPSGFFNISGTRFYISETEVNAAQAFIVCGNVGRYQPITLESEEKNTRIKNYLIEKGYTEPFWSAGDRFADVSPWRWEIKDLDFTYTDWRSGEAPDEYCGANFINHHCCMYFDQNGWYGGRCDSFQFIYRAFCEHA